MRYRLPWCVGDLLVGVALLLMAGGVSLVAGQHAREIANRVKCASNLRQIGQACLLYANENKGLYPRTHFKIGDDVKPTWGTPYEGNTDLLGAVNGVNPFVKDDDPNAKYRPADADVTAAFYLLMSTQDITSAVFVCPSSGNVAWDFGGAAQHAMFWTNWAGNDVLARSLSYSYQNPYPKNAAVSAGFRLNSSIAADFAVASDMNPGGDAVLKVTLTSGPAQMRQANTLNHQQDGQNVLYGDGHVEFQNNPFCGSARDNIFTADGPELKEPARTGKAAIAASPASPTDSILLPTQADIGYKPPPPPKPLTPAEVEKLKTMLPGQFDRQRPRRATLTIDATTIRAVSGPTTTTYTYRIVDADQDGLSLELTAPDTPARRVGVMVLDKGVAFDRGTDPALDGAWARGK